MRFCRTVTRRGISEYSFYLQSLPTSKVQLRRSILLEFWMEKVRLVTGCWSVWSKFCKGSMTGEGSDMYTTRAYLWLPNLFLQTGHTLNSVMRMLCASYPILISCTCTHTHISITLKNNYIISGWELTVEIYIMSYFSYYCPKQLSSR